jgi:outer membrane receptor protein involved in Fe transport
MTIKNYLLNFLFLLFIINSVSAQKGTIKGTILDNQNNSPIEYASVALLNSLDNSVITGDVSNKNGVFTIKNINSGNYKLKIYFVGYQEQILDNISIQNNQSIQLEPIKLKLGNQVLDEVVVKVKKANSSNKIDKQQYKASQFETAKGGSAIDVIKNLPSVTVNGQGDIALRGSNGFMVLVNGKPVLTDAATVLSQLPANTIENIELITAPSAKYDPDGKGGIINIVTTKGSTDGFALSTNLTGGLPSTDDYDNLEKP